jgi:hypothetical protein
MQKELDLVVRGEQAPRMGEVLSRRGFKHVREPVKLRADEDPYTLVGRTVTPALAGSA